MAGVANGVMSGSAARRQVRLRRLLRALGPAMVRPEAGALVSAAIGAAVTLALCALILSGAQALVGAPGLKIALVAPLAASAFLLFAVPSSPLAQPWSAVVGNGVSALAAVGVVKLGLPLAAGIALAVMAAVLLMGLLRAMHPPGAAMALAVVLIAEGGQPVSFDFVLTPALLDTVLLVALASVWARLTGRRYPFRQPAQPGPHRTADPSPKRRQGLAPADLEAILGRLRLSANLGVEDYGRLLDEAGDLAARRRLAGRPCASIMSRDLVTVQVDTPVATLRDLFRQHRIKTLPVLDAEGQLAGLLTLGDLLLAGDADTAAGALMSPHPECVQTTTPVSALITLLADGAQQAVPVLDGGRLAGLISRSDLIAELARS